MSPAKIPLPANLVYFSPCQVKVGSRFEIESSKLGIVGFGWSVCRTHKESIGHLCGFIYGCSAQCWARVDSRASHIHTRCALAHSAALQP